MTTSIRISCLRRPISHILIALAPVLFLSLVTSRAQASYTTVHDFTGPVADGSQPVGALVQDPFTGNCYGTTRFGGKANKGTVYCMSPSFGVTVIHSFAGADGLTPTSTLIIVPSPAGGPGTLYGTALRGGKAGFGTVFKVLTDGTGFKVLHNFLNTPDGAHPWAGVILASDGKLYGTTLRGGKFNQGTVYSLKTTGLAYAILHHFSGLTPGVPPDGAVPYARLFEYMPGFLVGTTVSGGRPNLGTVYTIAFSGAPYTLIHQFLGGPGDGANPTAELIPYTDPSGLTLLYGTTFNGGGAGQGTAYRLDSAGGSYCIVYNFLGGPGDGANPWAALFVGSTGLMYGTTFNGGAFGLGTIYLLAPAAACPFPEAVMHNFAGGFVVPPDGSNPYAALIQSVVDGNLYGTCYNDGATFNGTIYQQSP